MDTSKEYIKMCEKAEEMQEIKGFFEAGDCYYHTKYTHQGQPAGAYVASIRVVKKIAPNQKTWRIWLPRQDQLQDMIETGNPLKGEWALLDRFLEFCRPFKNLGTIPHPRDLECAREKNDYLDKFNSREQLWLAFVMKEKYNKKWNGDEWTQ